MENIAKKDKIGDLTIYHHKELKGCEGHKHNPFVDDTEME